MTTCIICRKSDGVTDYRSIFQPRRTCDKCDNRVIASMHAITDMARQLEPMLFHGAPTVGESNGGSSGPTASKPPVPVHVLSLLGPDQPENSAVYTHPGDQSGTPSIRAFIGMWARAWYAERMGEESWAARPPTPVTDITAGLGWLHIYRAWAARRSHGYGEFVAELRKLEIACLDVVAPSPGASRIGHCPVQVNGARCGQLLAAKATAAVIVCQKCGTKWPRWTWQKLGDDIAETES